MDNADLQSLDMEIRLLLEALYERYGYDFRRYTLASVRRRVIAALNKFRCATVSQLQSKVLHEPKTLPLLLRSLTVATTEMFRDPEVFHILVNKVFGDLATYPSIKIWHAGCSSGEEVYSLAILLEEAELLDRCIIYATDVNSESLVRAKAGVYEASELQKFTRSYQQAGGQRSLSDYYTADYGLAVFQRRLRENVVFAEHNLATDAVFTETHLVLCRNVLIYFDRNLQERVVQLFDESLVRGGYLTLGSKESLQFTQVASSYKEVEKGKRIYQKRKWI
jgi:chemotaxis protein methyltransferase CheR